MSAKCRQTVKEKALEINRGPFSRLKVAGAGGFEPPTTGFGDQRSGQTELRSYMVPLEGLEPPTRDLGRRRSIL